jgi:hypothetical protein
MKWRRKTARWALLAVIIFGMPWPGGVRTGLAVLQQPTPDPNTLIGIGAVLGRSGSYPSIMQIVKGGPADLDGRLKVNDRIAAVAQGNGAFVDCANLAIDEVVGMVRGKKGSTVRLQIIPAGAADPTKHAVISLVRARIKMTGQGIVVAPPMPVILQGLFAPAPAAAVPPANPPAPPPAPAPVAGAGAAGPSPAKPAASGTATPASSPAR